MNDWPAPEHARLAAQFEATMRVFDSLEDLRRDVEALRHELPTKRAAAPVASIVRVAVEAGILIAVAVVAGVGHFRPLLTVVLMAAALVSVIASECLAARSAYVPRSFAFTTVDGRGVFWVRPDESLAQQRPAEWPGAMSTRRQTSRWHVPRGAST